MEKKFKIKSFNKNFFLSLPQSSHLPQSQFFLSLSHSLCDRLLSSFSLFLILSAIAFFLLSLSFSFSLSPPSHSFSVFLCLCFSAFIMVSSSSFHGVVFKSLKKDYGDGFYFFFSFVLIIFFCSSFFFFTGFN